MSQELDAFLHIFLKCLQLYFSRLIPQTNLTQRMIAKKSAPSRYNAPQKHTPRQPIRAESPMSLDEQLLYIERWGFNQFPGCKQCQESGLGTRCFVAQKISTSCGNCLHTGKQCHFPATASSEEDHQ